MNSDRSRAVPWRFSYFNYSAIVTLDDSSGRKSMNSLISCTALSRRSASLHSAVIGPYSIGNQAGFKTSFDSVERELWDAFGVKRFQPFNFDVAAVFASIGL